MAYRPSKRIHAEHDGTHTNITPMMNLMVVLIPLLLTSAEFVRLGVIEINLPPAAVGPEAEMLAALPQEEMRRLDLSVTITDRGFFISSSLAVLSGDREGEPSIPVVNGAYDFDALSNRLHAIKRRAGNRFIDSDHLILMAEPEVDYQTVVSTMDAARSIRVNGRRTDLFPQVSLSAVIF